jgi:hypothetical protein
MKSLLKKEKMYAYLYEGKRHDAGDKFGFLKATVELRPQTRRSRRSAARVFAASICRSLILYGSCGLERRFELLRFFAARRFQLAGFLLNSAG